VTENWWGWADPEVSINTPEVVAWLSTDVAPENSTPTFSEHMPSSGQNGHSHKRSCRVPANQRASE